MKNKTLGTIAILITVIAWGISFISIKMLVDVISPMMLGLLRFSLSSAVIFLVMKGTGASLKVHKKDLPLLFFTGFIGTTIYFYFENNGIMLTTASVASIIIATIPVFTILGEALIYKTKPTWKLLFSIALSVAGVLMVMDIDLKEIFSGNGLGYLLMIGAVFAWVVYSLASKPLFKKYKEGTIAFYQSFFGMLMFIPFVFFETTYWDQITTPMIGHLLFLALIASAMGYYLYLYAIDQLGVGTSSLYINMIPVVTVIVSFLYLGESIGLLKVVGGVMVIASVCLATYKPKGRVEKKVQKVMGAS